MTSLAGRSHSGACRPLSALLDRHVMLLSRLPWLPYTWQQAPPQYTAAERRRLLGAICLPQKSQLY